MIRKSLDLVVLLAIVTVLLGAPKPEQEIYIPLAGDRGPVFFVGTAGFFLPAELGRGE